MYVIKVMHGKLCYKLCKTLAENYDPNNKISNDLFIFRVNTMVDVVTTRIFDAYSRFKPEDQRNQDMLITMDKLKRFRNDARDKKVFQRQIEKEVLFHIIHIHLNTFYSEFCTF